MEKTNKNSRLKWCVLGVLIALCVIYFAVPSVNAYDEGHRPRQVSRNEAKADIAVP